jgi:hypothetical protein
MIIEITEDEKELIIRLLRRAEIFAMNKWGNRENENNPEFIRNLKDKFMKPNN